MTFEMAGRDRLYLRQPRATIRSQRRSIRLVDLFCGSGGLTLGVEEAARLFGSGTDIRLAVERDPHIAAAYTQNFAVANGSGSMHVQQWFDRPPGQTLSLVERRTRKLVGGVDLLVGGPPCQGHSTLNNHTRGDDPKNGLYMSMIRAAEVLEAESVLVENVPAVERDADRTVDRAIRRLVKLGYNVDSDVVSVAEIGVPQLRKRHVLIAARCGTPSVKAAVDAARLPKIRTLRWAIGDLLRREGRTQLDTAAVLSPENLARARFLHRRDLYDLPNWYRPPCQRNEHRYKSMYGRLAWDAPAQTITTGFGSPGQGRYLHPERLRTLTPHEAARVQFFPDWYDFSAIPHRTVVGEAIGNAVPPKLAFVLAAHLLAVATQRERPGSSSTRDRPLVSSA